MDSNAQRQDSSEDFTTEEMEGGAFTRPFRKDKQKGDISTQKKDFKKKGNFRPPRDDRPPRDAKPPKDAKPPRDDARGLRVGKSTAPAPAPAPAPVEKLEEQTSEAPTVPVAPEAPEAPEAPVEEVVQEEPVASEEEEEEPEVQGLRLRRNYNSELRQKIEGSSSVPKPNITQMLNILGDTYNLTPTEGGVNIKGGPKSLVTFVTNYGINPDYNVDVPMTIKAFYNVFDEKGNPKDSFDSLLRKPAYHFICNHMMYRMVTLKMEIQLQNRSSLRRGELESMYDRFDEFMKVGKCGLISKAAAQEAFEREEKNLLIPTGSGAIVTAGLENKLNYIIAILNKFIEDGMRTRLKQLQENGFDCGIMADAIKEFENPDGMDMDTMVQKYLDLGVSSGGLKVCLGQMKMQTQDTGTIKSLIDQLGSLKEGSSLSNDDLKKLGEILGKADVEVGRKSEFKSLREDLKHLKAVVEKGECTSCAEGVLEASLPTVEEKPADLPSPQPPVRSTSPIADKFPIGSPKSLKKVHAPGSVGIGNTNDNYNPDADENPEDFPSAIPVPLYNAFISSIQVEDEKPLIAFQKLEALKDKVSGLKLENTDIFFIDKAVGFKLLLPPNKDFFKTKFNPKEVTDLGPMPIEGLEKQVKVNVFPIKYKEKQYHTFLLVPKANLKKEASPPVATVTAASAPVPEDKTAEEVEAVEDLKPVTVFEAQTLEREATPLSRGSPKSPEIEEAITPTATSDTVEKEIIDYKVYYNDGQPFMLQPKSNNKRDVFQLTINPKFVKPKLEVRNDTGITEPILIHMSNNPFMPVNINLIKGYVVIRNSSTIPNFNIALYGSGDKYIWIGINNIETSKPVQEGPVGTSSTGASAASTSSTGATAAGIGGTGSTSSTSSSATATASPATTGPELEIQVPGGSNKLDIESDKQYIFDVIIKKIKDNVSQAESTDQSQKDLQDLNKLLQYFKIEDNDLPEIRKTNPTRIGMFNIVKRRRVLSENQVNSLPDELQQIFRDKFKDLIVPNNNFITSIKQVPTNDDKNKLTPVIEKITTQLQTKPFVTEIEGITDEQKGLMKKYYDQLSGIVQIPDFKPSGMSLGMSLASKRGLIAATTAAIAGAALLAAKKGGTRRRDSNRIRYTRKRQQN